MSKPLFISPSLTYAISLTLSESSSPSYLSFPSLVLPENGNPPPNPPLTTTPPPLPPAQPPAWLWTCHICSTSYPLGATRRCLRDGHYFCAGATVQKRNGRVKRRRPCGSVFDYAGWQAYSNWRRTQPLRYKTGISPKGATAGAGGSSLRNQSSMGSASGSPIEKIFAAYNCELNCSFPSECRWRPHIEAGGSNAPSTPSPPSPPSPTSPTSPLVASPETVDSPEPLVSPASPNGRERNSILSPVSPVSPSGSRPPKLFSKLLASAERRAAGIAEFAAGAGKANKAERRQRDVVAQREAHENALEANASALEAMNEEMEMLDRSPSNESGSGDEVGAHVERQAVGLALPMELDAAAAAAVWGREVNEALEENWDWSVGGLGSCKGAGIGFGGEPTDSN